MVSKLRPYLADKAQKGELTDTFYECVGISSQRTNEILSGRCGATIKEINNVAKYFKISTSELIHRGEFKLSITKQCEHCSEDFIPSNARAIYCSNACRNKAFRANK